MRSHRFRRFDGNRYIYWSETSSSSPALASCRRPSGSRACCTRTSSNEGHMKRVLVSWSSGKDSAWLVHVLRQTADVELGGLLTTVNETADRVAMHAVRTELLQAQAMALGLPLRTVFIPSPCPNDVYERAMGAAVATAV